MYKMKINKGSRGVRGAIERTPLGVLIALLVISILFAVSLVVFFLFPYWSNGSVKHANREFLLTSDGHWDSLEAYGMDVWCPDGLTEESLPEDVSSSQKLFVTRDKGKFPEIAFGVIVATDEDIAGRMFDLDADPAGALDITTPLVNTAFGNMINGAHPSVSVDVEVISSASGTKILTGKGEATVTLVLQDPKNPDEPYAEETTTNIFYAVTTFYDRPVIVWGTWDYSTWEGEKRTTESVLDAINSLMRSEDSEVVEVPTEPVVEESPETHGETVAPAVENVAEN